MKKNTKILIGVGLAAAAFLLYKKSKYIPKIPTKSTTTVAPVEGCPDGTTEVAVDCVQAPCPTQCVENPQEIMPVFLPKRPTPEYGLRPNPEFVLRQEEILKMINKI
jgi:hypothetical protein